MRAWIGIAVAAALGGCVSVSEQAERLAPQHDAYCKSLGAKPGNADYTNCRIFLIGQLQRENEDRRRRFIEAIDDIQGGLNTMQRSQPRRTTCDRTLGGGFDCRTY